MNSVPSPLVFQALATAIETFEDGGDVIIRKVMDRVGAVRTSTIEKAVDGASSNLRADFDLSWLKAKTWPTHSSIRGEVRVVDLFSGCGALSLGVWEACRALELQFRPLLAVENDVARARVYQLNFPEAVCAPDPIETLFDGDLGAPRTKNEAKLLDRLGEVDLVNAGANMRQLAGVKMRQAAS